jgi:hypothetical protein
MLYRFCSNPIDMKKLSQSPNWEKTSFIINNAIWRWRWDSGMIAVLPEFGPGASEHFQNDGYAPLNSDPVQVGGTNYILFDPAEPNKVGVNVWACDEIPEPIPQPIPSPGEPTYIKDLKVLLDDVKKGINEILKRLA